MFFGNVKYILGRCMIDEEKGYYCEGRIMTGETDPYRRTTSKLIIHTRPPQRPKRVSFLGCLNKPR